jgi:hypothetical protein
MFQSHLVRVQAFWSLGTTCLYSHSHGIQGVSLRAIAETSNSPCVWALGSDKRVGIAVLYLRTLWQAVEGHAGRQTVQTLWLLRHRGGPSLSEGAVLLGIHTIQRNAPKSRQSLLLLHQDVRREVRTEGRCHNCVCFACWLRQGCAFHCGVASSCRRRCCCLLLLLVYV